VYRVAQNGSQQAAIGQINEQSVETMAWDRVGNLWIFDAVTSAFYTLNLSNSMTTLAHSAPTGNRSDNMTSHQISDVDAMDFDAFDSNTIWGVDRVDPGPDLIFSFNVTTGLLSGNILHPVTGVGDDIDDIGINPLTNQIFGIANNGGFGDQLVSINMSTGGATVIGPLVDPNGIPVNDMEGFTYDIDGQLIGTTGMDSAIPGGLWQIDENTGQSTLLRIIDDRCPDIESIACFNARIDVSQSEPEAVEPIVEVPCVDETITISSIPTLSEWGLMICGILIIILSVAVLQRSRQEA
jgi:hypothetical protein